jgi:hypothetical protein
MLAWVDARGRFDFYKLLIIKILNLLSVIFFTPIHQNTDGLGSRFFSGTAT